MSRAQDLAYMEMAYGLAERARGRSSPNPLVGSVIVKNGAIVGWGFHEEAGRPHAEINALEKAGRRAKGAAIYITLEPCVHWGRTPPCVDSLIAAGLSRAVISAYDPNPLVHRKGVRRLRQAGLGVSVGLLREKNDRLNEVYTKYITRGVPFVTLKAALSLDGKIAAATGDSRWISSAQTRDYIHLLRGEYDAIMVGINTLLRDDPLLTVRHGHWADKKIARVILDSRLRLPLTARILKTEDKGQIIVFTGKGAPSAKARALSDRGVDVVSLKRPLRDGGLPVVLNELAAREVAGLIVEGGGRLQTSFIEARLADKIVLTLSPKLIGGCNAPGFYGGEGVAKVQEALELKSLRPFSLGDDLILEGYF